MNLTVTSDMLESLLEKTDAPVVFDVRREEDRKAEPVRITGAEWKNPGDVTVWGRELSPGTRVVVYCVKGGPVSQSVRDALRAQGVDAASLDGGIREWVATGRRTETT